MKNVMEARATLARLLIGAALTVPLAACDRNGTPTGQVVATVDGTDVTRRELVFEMQATNAAASADSLKALQPALVQQVLDRKLLVAQAKREGVDKTPEYLAASQRADEALLVQQLVQRWSSKADTASGADVQAFIVANPHMFGGRRLFEVDQIRGLAKGVTAAEISPLQTNAAVADLLRLKGQKIQRGSATIDSINLSPMQYAELTRLAPGEPIVAMNGGVLVSNAIVDIRDAPVPIDQQVVIAKAAMKEQATRSIVSNQLRSLRQEAKIKYQPGFAPPAAGPSAGLGSAGRAQ